MSTNGKTISPYHGDLQDRLRNLSARANCPTRQENGQRYLGPPHSWTKKPPQNSEVFISKLPSDCFEDEIYDFCSQAGDIYLIRLMINFENENRGFCFVTYACPQQAAAAVSLLPQTALRKGHFVHAEISMNNCSLKMYGLDYHSDDATLENVLPYVGTYRLCQPALTLDYGVNSTFYMGLPSFKLYSQQLPWFWHNRAREYQSYHRFIRLRINYRLYDCNVPTEVEIANILFQISRVRTILGKFSDSPIKGVELCATMPSKYLTFEIRTNTKDVVNVTIKRNTTQRTLMATLYFDTHQKAAIARRKLSQIANSRWGQNVKVFLWSKKLQNKLQLYHKDSDELKCKENNKFVDRVDVNRSSRYILSELDVNSYNNEKNNVISKRENITKSDFHARMSYPMDVDLRNSCRKEEIISNYGDTYCSQDYNFSSPERSYDSISNYSTLDSYEDSFFPSLSPMLCNEQFSPSKNCSDEPFKKQHPLLSPVRDDTSINNAGSTLWDSDPIMQLNQWNIESPCKSDRDSLNYDSPFNFSPQKPGDSAVGYSPRQIELILNEASQVLGNFCLSDYA